MSCATCKSWLLRRETRYGNGEVIVNWSDPSGKGKCEVLKIETTPDFGCNKYEDGGPIVLVDTKEGAPWHHAVPGPCPKCGGKASAVTDAKTCQCCGTGTVLYYDDGYIGDNATKMHPKEKQWGKRGTPPTPTCFNCGRSIETDWMACPRCGTRLKEAKPDVVGGALVS